ncbi:hypothetical protein ATO12_05500 [Aquimarina atlantica]|uniref:Uncharacterized protein n=1 Tax=Aquimarina atlantica TaxID=1317122 RepID=A0A023BPG4_9FLAO|nr:hypothetical protein [Aquimarina atlantica]EZH71834.1 hypothetical protein ATO12_05500 [Aquimarina atlantica]
MAISSNISKKPPVLKSMDYFLLREKGITGLQDLAGDTWTDHNIHDPGITILEVLCYALTELGNRINLPIEDILSSQPGITDEKLESVFPNAQKILPNCAWTEKDLRKILIDIVGVRNIYLQKALQAEQEFFYSESLKLIIYDPTPISVDLNGLYQIKVELENSQNFGDLNSNIIITDIEVNVVEPRSFEVSIAVPYWDEADPQWLEPGAITDIVFTAPVSAVTDDPITTFFGELAIEIDNSILIEDFSFSARIEPPIQDISNVALINAVITELETLAQDITVDSIFSSYKRKLEEINTIIQEVQQVFYANRNLCEDLLQIEAVRIQEIAINTTIELRPDADPNKLLARIYFVIDQFLCPTFLWYTLDRLKELGLRIDEILEGPFLSSGFIRNEDLDAIIREGIVYTSDLIRLIMNQEGVFSVSGLTISNFIDNILVSGATPETNCLRLIDTDRFKPKFSISKSEIIFERNGIVVPVEQTLVDAELTSLENAAASIPGTSDLGLEIPTGEKLLLDQYHSIQNEFPATYGVGKNNISNSASDLRISQSLQLKAYLTFFDQILANYSSQIANLCQFYSPDEAIDRTYYNQPLYTISGIDSLLVSFLQSGVSFENFIADPENGYRIGLDTYFENNTVFLDRRSRLLDHLLARFGENFPDPASLLYSDVNIYLIRDKIRFFQNYIEISSNRGKAFEINPQPGGGDVWDTDNISGLQKRLGYLFGIPDLQRRNYSGDPNPNDYFDFFSSGPNFGFRLLDHNSDILLESELFPNINSAENAAIEVISLGVFSGNYGSSSIQNIDGEDYMITPLQDNTLSVIANLRILLDTSIPEDLLRNKAINIAKNNLLQIHRGGEGFYLIEHVLLRPIRNNISNVDAFLPAIFNSEENFPVTDPYSFRISFFFPSGFERDFGATESGPQPRIWSFRMRSRAFREFMERTIREETPAHILPEIYFLDTNTGIDTSTTPSLNNFENVYRNWLINKTDTTATETDLTNSHNELVAVLNEIINP